MHVGCQGCEKAIEPPEAPSDPSCLFAGAVSGAMSLDFGRALIHKYTHLCK